MEKSTSYQGQTAISNGKEQLASRIGYTIDLEGPADKQPTLIEAIKFILRNEKIQPEELT